MLLLNGGIQELLGILAAHLVLVRLVLVLIILVILILVLVVLIILIVVFILVIFVLVLILILLILVLVLILVVLVLILVLRIVLEQLLAEGKIITGLIVLWIASQRHLVVFDGLCIFTVVLHDHAHVVIAGCTAEAVGFQLGSIGKLLYRHGVFLLRHERTTKIVYRLWILLILGDSLAILGFCHCPFLRFEGTIALTDQVAISLGSGLCRTHQQHCHCYYYIMYILHFYIYIKAFALSGRLATTRFTQGDALG